MYPTLKGSQRVSPQGVVGPANQAAGAANSGWIDASQFLNFMALVKSGTLGSSGTVDAKFQQAQDGSGTGAKDVTGKSITQITANNKQAIIDLKQEDLDINNGFTFIELIVTVGTATSEVDAVVLGLDPRMGAANEANPASVLSIT